jgi:hypothetical protein
MFRSVARLEEGRTYDDLLLEARTSRDRVDPRVFVAGGSQLLWTGGRPRLFRRLLRRGKLGPDLRSASALVWTAWASLSPATLRGFLALLLKTRNRSAGKKVDKGAPILWRPGHAATALPAQDSNAGSATAARSARPLRAPSAAHVKARK